MSLLRLISGGYITSLDTLVSLITFSYLNFRALSGDL